MDVRHHIRKSRALQFIFKWQEIPALFLRPKANPSSPCPPCSLPSSTSSPSSSSSYSSYAHAPTRTTSFLGSWIGIEMGALLPYSTSLSLPPHHLVKFKGVENETDRVIMCSVFGPFWKCARVGERLSPYVSICCVIMAVSGLDPQSSICPILMRMHRQLYSQTDLRSACRAGVWRICCAVRK